MINVLVVDDSPTFRMLLVGALKSDAEIEVVGTAVSGEQAIEQVDVLRPDLVTMDVVMADMDGLEATRRIMAVHPTPILIVTALSDSPEANLAFEAMRAGALDVIGKPEGGRRLTRVWVRDLVTKVKSLAAVDNIVTEETYGHHATDETT